MNVASIIMSLQKEILTAPASQKQFLSPKPIFDPVHPSPIERPPPLRSGVDQIRPVAIFSRPDIRDIPPVNSAPPFPIEPATGPFAELDKDIEKEIQLFRAEADKANEEALRKQIEALKNIISAQKNRVSPTRPV